MFSFAYRLNAVLTFAVMAFTAICFSASMTDIMHTSSPTVNIQVMKFDGLRRSHGGSDEDMSYYDNLPDCLGSANSLESSGIKCPQRRKKSYEDSTPTAHRGGYASSSEHCLQQARVLLNISADLSSLFTWNTKQLFVFVAAEYVTSKNSVNQISLWDSIIQSKEEAKFQLLTYNKYSLIDQGNDLRGTNFSLTMYWHAMPKTGRMFQGNYSITGFQFPSSYF